MILFIKHILRDIKRNPLQPILIILTLILSVSCAVTAFCSEKMFRDHSRALSGEQSELGDIIISVGSADTRILFESDAEKVLGNKADVLGDFKLTGLTKNREEPSFISISATDLPAADRYFEFSYFEYGSFTVENLNSSAIISKSFAAKEALGIGDTVSFTLLGKEFTYTVEAIAEGEGLLASSDMLISIDGIIGTIAESVPAVSAVSGIITPYTRLLIKADGGADPSTLLKSLNAVPEFSGYRIEITNKSAQRDYIFMIQLGAVLLISGIIILLAAILTGTSQRLLETKRRIQYATFSAAGASRAQIDLLRYAESGIYSLIGAVGGIALAIPLTKKVGALFEWNDTVLTVGIRGIVFGALFSPLLILTCTAIHIKRQKEISLSEQMFEEDSEKLTGERISRRSAVIWITLFVLSMIAIFVVPTSKRFIPAFFVLLILLKNIYAFTPSIIRFLSSFASDILSKAKKCRGTALLLTKSFKNRFALKHVTRLTVILLTLIFSVNLCRTTLGSAMSSVNDLVTADRALVGVNSVIADKIADDPSVSSVTSIGIFRGTELPMGYTLTSISVKGDIDACINNELTPPVLPSGKEAAISKGVAKLLGISEGDALNLKINGTEYGLTVCDIIDTGISTVFIDAEGLGLGHNAVCFNFSDSVKNDETAKNELISRLEANGASVIEPKYLFGTISATATGFIELLKYATVACVVLALAGCINTLAAFYRSRRREFLILRLSGMNRSRLIAFIAFEFALIAVISLLFSIPLCAIMTFIIDTVLGSFGFSVFI